MKVRIIFGLIIIFIVVILTGCKKIEEPTNNETNETNKQEEQINNNNEDNTSNNGSETITSVLFNCKDCVFAYYTDNKKIGDTLSKYTSDYNTLKDKNGKQRRSFIGHIIDESGIIKRAFVCGIEKEKAFCIEGGTNASRYDYNINIMNQIYGKNECKYDNNGKTYTCSGEIEISTKVSGEVSTSEICYVLGEKTTMSCN